MLAGARVTCRGVGVCGWVVIVGAKRSEQDCRSRGHSGALLSRLPPRCACWAGHRRRAVAQSAHAAGAAFECGQQALAARHVAAKAARNTTAHRRRWQLDGAGRGKQRGARLAVRPWRACQQLLQLTAGGARCAQPGEHLLATGQRWARGELHRPRAERLRLPRLLTTLSRCGSRCFRRRRSCRWVCRSCRRCGLRLGRRWLCSRGCGSSRGGCARS